MVRIQRIGVIFFVVVFILAAGLAAQAEPLKIRVGWVTTPSNPLPLVWQKTDIMKYYGKTYTVELTAFKGTPLVMQAFAAKALDVGTLSYAALANAITRQNMDLRILADGVQDGPGGHFTTQYVVLADSPIKKAQDLKGKTIATNAQGAALHLAHRVFLGKLGMKDQRDYTTVEVSFPAMATFLKERKVDVVPLIMPFYALAKKSGLNFRTIFTVREGQGDLQISFTAARGDFLDQNQAAVRDFMTDYLRGHRWLFDPKNRSEMLELVAKFTKRPVKAYEDWLYTKEDYYHDPNGIPNMKALQNNINQLFDLGELPAKLDVSKHAALSLLDMAAKRIAAGE
ncbi:MAG: ABC transporter substrate-binding protein [Candidatus Tectomicrobia bacterium]|nr:ABC transporter substrate-binding protein [Candidatus Tectomicrobia bacterium]